jgi:hypothetical protein
MEQIRTPLDTRPKTVAIVGMGPSSSDYFLYNWKKKNLFRVDEVWGINSTLGSLQADKTFIMDDLRGIEKRYPEWGDRLKLTKETIITCNAYPEYPTAYAYPLQQVLEVLRDGYFLNTPAFAIGYAIATGVQELWLFGCDFSYPGTNAVEGGAQNVAYLLGFAKGSCRMHYRIPGSSTLLDANLARQDPKDGSVKYPLYGYEFNPGEAAKRITFNQAQPGDHALADRQPKIIKVPEPMRAAEGQQMAQALMDSQKPKEGTNNG